MTHDIRYIALDLDGTLTNDRKEITPLTLQTLLDVQQRGVRLILASGRPPFGMRPLAQQLHMAEHEGLLLCYNGGHIEKTSASKEVLYEIALDDALIPQLLQFQQESGTDSDGHPLLTLMTYYEDTIYTMFPENKYVNISAYNNKMRVQGVKDFVRDTPRPLNKCLMVGDPAIVPEWESKMQKAMEGRMHICHSTPYFIEMLPCGIDKGTALEQLMLRLGLTTANLMAFGDSYNDIGMLRAAAIGVAMGNAEAAVKAVADYITDTNEADGVAKAIQHYLPL